MRPATLTLLVLFFSVALTAQFQNSDVAVLFGVSPQNVGLEGGRTRSPMERAILISYAYQFYENANGRLYYEAPNLVLNGADRRADETLSRSDNGNNFLMHGIRFQRDLNTRLAVFVAADAGVQFQSYSGASLVDGVVVRESESKISPAVGVGAGIGFRLSPIFSLRAELRDIVGGKSFDADRRHNVIALFGVAAHF